MEQPPASPIALLNRGIAAYHEGDSDEALRLLAQALLIDPDSELGWLWFAAVTDDPAQRTDRHRRGAVAARTGRP